MGSTLSEIYFSTALQMRRGEEEKALKAKKRFTDRGRV